MYALLERHKFIYPVCFDEEDSLNKLNHFPTDMAFQTFLLNSDNKVLAIGNPINPKVKELYLKIIQSEKIGRKDESKVTRTKAIIRPDRLFKILCGSTTARGHNILYN